MAKQSNNPAPHAGEKEAPAIPKDGQTPGMGAPPSFDEGERKPAPIERTGDDGVRSAPPSSPASSKTVSGEGKKHTEATMPPGAGVDPKRNTM